MIYAKKKLKNSLDHVNAKMQNAKIVHFILFQYIIWKFPKN